MDIKESDWKVFRRLSDLALERYCERVLDEVRELAAKGGSSHERYLKLWKVMKKRDDTLADAFNDRRRSRAVIQLLQILREDLLTPEEFNQFSEELRNRIEVIRTIGQ